MFTLQKLSAFKNFTKTHEYKKSSSKSDLLMERKKRLLNSIRVAQ